MMKGIENWLDSPQKINNHSPEQIRHTGQGERPPAKPLAPGHADQVQISEDGRKLQKSNNEIALTKDLLARLPDTRAHVIYEAVAKIKAGFYPGHEISKKAAEKLRNQEVDEFPTSGNR